MTHKASKIHLSIAFGDAILPIIDCEDGHQRVPLKQICDVVGINWSTQKRKFKEDAYLTKRLGLEYHPLKGVEICQKPGNPTHICIRLDRVTAFLNTINPENVRAMGNHDAADWLEAKHQEWDDALHQYETAGFAINKSYYSTREAKEKGYLRIMTVLREKNKTQDMGDRRLIATIIKDMADQYGVHYQTDLLDDLQSA